MKIERTVTWTTASNKKVEVQIERIKDVRDNIVDADGYKVNTGKETVDQLSIEVFVDGKFVTRSYNRPEIITENSARANQLRAKGAYARLGDSFVKEEQYNMIIAALNEIEAELTPTQEFEAVRAQETEKENRKMENAKEAAAEYTQMIRNGFCPKCHSYCYGDCES